MKNKFFITGLLLMFFFTGCASITSGPVLEEKISSYKKGYKVGVIEIKTGNFETPPYLPTKIKHELTEILRNEGMLLEGAGGGKTLSVFIKTSARYIGGASGTDRYSELNSIVILKDINDPCYTASTSIIAYNGFGPLISDFVERSHAKDMFDFIKRASAGD